MDFQKFFILFPITLFSFQSLRENDSVINKNYLTNFLSSLIIFIISYEIYFFFLHLLLHRNFLFKRVHKVHHHHAKLYSLVSNQIHFVEYISGYMIPIFFGKYYNNYFKWIFLSNSSILKNIVLKLLLK